MASTPKTSVRLTPIIRAYLDDLAKLGAYGKGRAGVMRRFIENGIKDAIEKKVIAPGMYLSSATRQTKARTMIS